MLNASLEDDRIHRMAIAITYPIAVRASFALSAFVFVCALGGHTSARAELIDRGAGLIYDTDRDITWLAQTPSYASTMNWFQATSYVSNLEYFDPVRNITWSDWRLPTGDGCAWSKCDGGELGHLYFNEIGGLLGFNLQVHHNSEYDLFPLIYPKPYWTSFSYPTNPKNYAMTFDFYLGVQKSEDKYNGHAYAWAVRDGDVGMPVHEPAPVVLTLTGLAVLSIARRQRWRLPMAPRISTRR